MPIPYSSLINKKYLILILALVLAFISFLFSRGRSANAADSREHLTSSGAKNVEEGLSELQKEARLYRSQGLELQRIGDLDGAMSLYVKAAEMDPLYAVAQNDLGIIYEAKGLTDKAEEAYLKCLKIDPHYLSAYSNLALLYESKRDLDKAVFYWQERAKLGLADDPWTEKAHQRLKDIQAVQSGSPASEREQEVIGLMKDVLNQRAITKQDNRELAKTYFQKAKQSYDRQDEVTALKLAIDAQALDPTNEEIEAFVDKIQRRLLSK
jgi:tetratricopeptide (TPR) repeat protein